MLHFEKLARSLNRSMAEVGSIIPGLILGILKFNLLFLFFWYAAAFLSVLHGPLWWMGAVSAATGLALCAWLALQGFGEEWGRQGPIALGRGSFTPFLLLVAIPVGVVVICTVLGLAPGVFEKPGLLGWTALQTKRLVYWVQH